MMSFALLKMFFFLLFNVVRPRKLKLIGFRYLISWNSFNN